MDYLSFLVHEIHTAVVATVDDEGLPVLARTGRYLHHTTEKVPT